MKNAQMQQQPSSTDGQMNPVSVILVAYNNAEEIEGALVHVPRHRYIQSVVYDNSTDQGSSCRLVEIRDSGKIDILLGGTGENLGFARAVNAAIQNTSSENDILLLNPDTELDDGCFEHLRAAAYSDCRVAITCPVVYSHPSVKTMSAGEQPTIIRMLLHYSGISRIFHTSSALRGRYLFLSKHATVDRAVGWAAACVWYIRREAFEELGPLSERWFMYGEDAEYCRRANRYGWSIQLVSRARAYHAMGSTVRRAGKTVRRMWPINTYDYYCTEFAPGYLRRLIWRLVFTAGLGSRAIVYLASRRTRDRGKSLVELSIAVWDGNARGKAHSLSPEGSRFE